MKKSYNPFKMWGSWIGVGVAGIWFLIAVIFGELLQLEDIASKLFILLLKLNPVSYLIYFCEEHFCGTFIGLISMLSMPVASFLIGWGIHSLIRKTKSN